LNQDRLHYDNDNNDYTIIIDGHNNDNGDDNYDKMQLIIYLHAELNNQGPITGSAQIQNNNNKH
jgi:hypothetical protein